MTSIIRNSRFGKIYSRKLFIVHQLFPPCLSWKYEWFNRHLITIPVLKFLFRHIFEAKGKHSYFITKTRLWNFQGTTSLPCPARPWRPALSCKITGQGINKMFALPCTRAGQGARTGQVCPALWTSLVSLLSTRLLIISCADNAKSICISIIYMLYKSQ